MRRARLPEITTPRPAEVALQAMVDIAADAGWLHTALGAMSLTQMVSQGRFLDAPPLSDLPGMSAAAEEALAARGLTHLAQLVRLDAQALKRALGGTLGARQLSELSGLLATLPATELEAAPPPLAVEAGADCAISVTVSTGGRRARRSAFAPAFPKARGGGWWLVMGEGDELFALKRINLPSGSGSGPLKTELMMCAPEEPGVHECAVLLVSDSYIGLDQQVTVRVEVR